MSLCSPACAEREPLLHQGHAEEARRLPPRARARPAPRRGRRRRPSPPPARPTPGRGGAAASRGCASGPRGRPRRGWGGWAPGACLPRRMAGGSSREATLATRDPRVRSCTSGPPGWALRRGPADGPRTGRHGDATGRRRGRCHVHALQDGAGAHHPGDGRDRRSPACAATPAAATTCIAARRPPSADGGRADTRRPGEKTRGRLRGPARRARRRERAGLPPGRSTYAVDQVVRHPTFGLGIVRAVRQDKMDVAFKAAERTLVQGRGSGRGSPLLQPTSPTRGRAGRR